MQPPQVKKMCARLYVKSAEKDDDSIFGDTQAKSAVLINRPPACGTCAVSEPRLDGSSTPKMRFAQKHEELRVSSTAFQSEIRCTLAVPEVFVITSRGEENQEAFTRRVSLKTEVLN